jgi:hypothetical protein
MNPDAQASTSETRETPTSRGVDAADSFKHVELGEEIGLGPPNSAGSFSDRSPDS